MSQSGNRPKLPPDTPSEVSRRAPNTESARIAYRRKGSRRWKKCTPARVISMLDRDRRAWRTVRRRHQVAAYDSLVKGGAKRACHRARRMPFTATNVHPDNVPRRRRDASGTRPTCVAPAPRSPVGRFAPRSRVTCMGSSGSLASFHCSNRERSAPAHGP